MLRFCSADGAEKIHVVSEYMKYLK